MKNFRLLFSLALSIILLQNSYSQSNSKDELKDGTVKSLAIKGNTLEILKNLKQDIPSYTINSSGILKPAQGFVIRYVKKLDKFYITPNTGEIQYTPLDGTADLGNGITLNCYSDTNCPTCLPDYVGGIYFCKSNGCKCYGEIIMSPIECKPIFE